MLKREDTLVAEVVDAEQAAGAGKKRVTPQGLVQVDRNQPGLPVMGVNNVGGKLEMSRQFQRCPAEQAEAFGVVRIVLALFAVELPAAEIGRAVNEVNLHPLHLSAPPDDLLNLTAHGDGDFSAAGTKLAGAATHARVPGHNKAYVMSQFVQGWRQRSDDVGQPSRLGEGGGLGGDHQHIHRRSGHEA